jgi:predicted dehydrogenase
VAGTAVVAGTDGTLSIAGNTVQLADRHGVRALDVPSDLELPPVSAETDDARERFTRLEIGPYTKLAEAFAALIRSEQLSTPVPVPTFVDGVAEMRVIDAIRASARDGGALVEID